MTSEKDTVEPGQDPPSVQKRLAFFTVPFILLLLFVELAFRAMGYGGLRDSPPYNGQPPNLYYWVADSQLGFRNRPNGHYVYTAVEGRPVSSTDDKGYRNGLGWAQRSEHPPQVAILGDSMVFGVELPDDQTIPSAIARRLGSPVVNTGVRAYSTIQEKRILPRVLADFPGVKVVLYVYVDNDLPGNLIAADDPVVPVPLMKYEGSGQPFAELDPQVPPDQVGKPFDATPFARPRPAAQAAVRRFLILSHSAALNQLLRYAQNLSSSGGGGEFAVPQGVEYNEAIGHLALRQVLTETRDFCERNHIRFLAARASDTNSELDMRNEKGFLADCQASGVQAIPSAAKFVGNPHKYMTAFENYSGYDFHYGPAGASLFADIVTPAIQQALGH